MPTVNLPASAIELAKALTGLSTKDAAVRAVIDLAKVHSKDHRIPNEPNAATAKALKAKAGKGDADITTDAGFQAWLSEIPDR